MISAHKVLVGKPEGKKLLGRPRHRWEDNIKMGLTYGMGACTVFILLKRGSSGPHF
jgi:hypothetical protein